MPQPRDKKIEEAGGKRMKLYHGDCLEIMKDIPDGSIDMILCDLPYGTTNCKWDSVIPFASLWKQYKRIIKENSAIVLFGCQPFTSALVMSNPKWYRYDWYWKKERGVNFLMANRMPFKVIETISVFYKKQPTYNPQKRNNPNGIHNRANNTFSNESFGGQLMKNRPKKVISSARYEPDKVLPTQLLEFNRDKDRVHPTQKPVSLLENLICTYTNGGETVLDNCMGSGSTGIACINTNRRFIGIEKEEKYFDIATKRINEHTQQLGLL